MATMSHYGLGTYAGGVAGITRLDDLLVSSHTDPYPASYQPYATLAGVKLTGAENKQGSPRAHWHWDWLPQPDIDILLGYEGTVYVRTEKHTGWIRAFATFSGLMLEPKVGEAIKPEHGEPFYPQARGPVDIDIIDLVEV